MHPQGFSSNKPNVFVLLIPWVAVKEGTYYGAQNE